MASVSSRVAAASLVGLILAVGCVRKSDTAQTAAPSPVPITVAQVGLVGRVESLDPARAGNAATIDEVSRVYETLLAYDYPARPYRLVPLLAMGMPEGDVDGLTYRLKLKSGVLFQDCGCFASTGGRGRELVAEDVVYSFKRAADPQNPHLGWPSLKGRIDGLDAWREAAAAAGKTDYSIPVSGIQAVDRYTVEFHLRKSYVNFPHILAQAPLAIVPREAVEAGGRSFGLRPTGTGPFVLARFDPISGLEWVRNRTFRLESSAPADSGGGRVPSVDGVRVRFFGDSESQWKAFEGGELDLIEVPAAAFATAFTPVKELKPELSARGWGLWKSVRLDTTFIGISMKDPVLAKNRGLRQAMSLAFRSEVLADVFYGGRATPAEGPIPPGMLGYDPGFRNPFRRFHAGKAREMFARTGLAEAFAKKPLVIGVEAGPLGEKMGEMILRSFAAIGISAEVRALPWNELRAAISGGKVHVWTSAWTADFPEAESALQPFYGGAGSEVNEVGYSNPEFDLLFERALGETNSEQRAKLYRQMQTLVAEDCPWIFGVHRVSYVLTQPWLRGYRPGDFGQLGARYWKIAKDR